MPLTQNTSDESKISSTDIVSQILQLEHFGRERCMGMETTPTHSFGILDFDFQI